MKLIGIIYKNTETPDFSTLEKAPDELKYFLAEINGVIAYKGGLHIRGCCSDPAWHSLKEAWEGKLAFWKNYPDILDTDIPFGQDCMGEQFLLRNNKVIKLFSETGEVESLGISFLEFLNKAEEDPINFLGMHPLIQFEMDGKKLEPGKLLCLSETAAGLHMEQADMQERIFSLANYYKRSKDPEGEDDVSFFVGG